MTENKSDHPHFANTLFGCSETMGEFCCVLVCPWCGPAYLTYKWRDKMDGKGTMGCLLSCCCPICGDAINRAALRDHYGIEGTLISDCVLMYCCYPCAFIQTYREANERFKMKEKEVVV